MAKLQVSADYFLRTLFPGENLRLKGVEFDWTRGTVILDIDGDHVPDVDEVMCEVTQERLTFAFKPISTGTSTA